MMMMMMMKLLNDATENWIINDAQTLRTGGYEALSVISNSNRVSCESKQNMRCVVVVPDGYQATSDFPKLLENGTYGEMEQIQTLQV